MKKKSQQSESRKINRMLKRAGGKPIYGFKPLLNHWRHRKKFLIELGLPKKAIKEEMRKHKDEKKKYERY